MQAYMYYDASHARNYDDKGIDFIELFEGTHDEVKICKYFMRPGATLTPALFADKAVFYVFGKGQGLIRDEEALHIIDEVCFYAPNYGSTPYTIQAATELEFMQVIANMDSDDQEKRAIAEIHLPFFRKESQCDCYDQDCKTPGNTSRTVIWGEFDRLGRITCGTCEGYNGEGTIEEGHPSVHQWNYAVGNADYWMTVGSGKDKETYFRKAGDLDFIPAGPDHMLFAGYGKCLHYVWVEFNTNKKGK